MAEDMQSTDLSQDGLRERLADALSEMGYSIDRDADIPRSGIDLTIEDSTGRTILVNVRDILTPEFIQQKIRFYSRISGERAPSLIVTSEEPSSTVQNSLTALGRIWVARWRGDADNYSLAIQVKDILEAVPFYTDPKKQFQSFLKQVRDPDAQ